MADINNAGILASAGVQGQELPTEQVPQEVPAEPQAAPGDTEVKPEEQESYDRVVMAGMKALYENDATKKGIMDMLKADAQNPAKALANAASMIIMQLDKQSGDAIPEGVIVPAAVEFLEQVSELADSANLFPVDEAVMNHAGQLMLVTLGEQYGADPSDIQGIMDSSSPEELQEIESTQGNFARKQPPQEIL